MEMQIERDEKLVISRAQAGDLEAFNELVVKYQDVVFAQAVRLVGDPALGEDLAQETFIRAYEKLGSYRGGSFKFWLLRIVSNLAFDEIRRWKKYSLVPLDYTHPDGDEQEASWSVDPEPLPEAQLERRQLKDSLQACLMEMPEGARAVLVLVDAQGLDYAEAAEVLGVPTGTIKSRLARARVQLRSLLARKTPAPSEADRWEMNVFENACMA